MGSCRRRAGERRTSSTREAGIVVLVPKVDGVVELDADLFTAFGVAEAVDDFGLGTRTFIFAAEDDRAAFFYWAAAEERGAVAANAYGPGFFVPGLVRVFTTQPDGDGGNGARAAADALAELRKAQEKIEDAGFHLSLREARVCCGLFGLLRERVCGQCFGSLGAGGDEGFQCVGGIGVEGKISEALVARFNFRDACGKKVFKAEGAAREINGCGGVAGRGGAPSGLLEERCVRR